MKAVARLVYSYFAGSPVLRVLTLLGLGLIAIDFYILMAQPHSGDKLWIAILGVIALFTGSSLMPVTFGRLARSHAIGVLPGGRVKLLASAYITTVLVALPAGVLGPAAFVSDMSSLQELMKNPQAQVYVLQMAGLIFTSALLFAGWIYVAMWFLTSQRNTAGLFKGLLVVMLVIFAPARDLQDLTLSLAWNLQQIAVLWIVFGVGFLFWPRFKAARARRTGERFAGLARIFFGRTAGREFDLLLGTSNPWLLIAGLALPLLFVTRFVREVPSVWLYFLTILSAVTGAYSGQAADRSRALWLRGDWSRSALFSAVERSIWRHNAHVLGALILVAAGIGLYSGFPASLLLTGLPLLVLGTVMSTYLGLIITRGLRWLEITAGVVVMLLLMALAVFIAGERVGLVTVFALEAGLAAFAVVLRFVARRRWTQIDWMLCRADRAMAARSA